MRHYLLALLNSRLLEFFYKATTVPKANSFFIYKTMFLKNMPIRRIDFANPLDKARHDRLVDLVQYLLGLQKSLTASKMAYERNMIQGQCAAIDSQIERLVYELYEIREPDVAVIKGASAHA